jgi:hypothetical protein
MLPVFVPLHIGCGLFHLEVDKHVVLEGPSKSKPGLHANEQLSLFAMPVHEIDPWGGASRVLHGRT